MPLKLGTSPQTRAKNVAKMVGEGYPQREAITVAHKVQKKAQATKVVAPVKKGKK